MRVLLLVSTCFAGAFLSEPAKGMEKVAELVAAAHVQTDQIMRIKETIANPSTSHGQKDLAMAELSDLVDNPFLESQLKADLFFSALSNIVEGDLSSVRHEIAQKAVRFINEASSGSVLSFQFGRECSRNCVK